VESDGSGEDAASRQPYLFRLVADHLFETRFYLDSLNFYQNLRHLPREIDGTLLVRMGKCFLQAQDDRQAEECFQRAVEFDGEDIDPRIELAHMYERMGKPEQAFYNLNEVMLLRKRRDLRDSCSPFEDIVGRGTEKASVAIKKPTRRRYRPRKQTQNRLAQVSEAEYLQSQYFVLRKEREAMRSGDAESTDAWMGAARDLTDEFRGFKKFYPLDKYIKFLGYSGDSRIALESSLDMDLTAMAERLSRGLCRPFSHLWNANQCRLDCLRADRDPNS
jgi:general transcription factor 3C polypeptide 3 (transcription factor C subunit 4)